MELAAELVAAAKGPGMLATMPPRNKLSDAYSLEYWTAMNNGTNQSYRIYNSTDLTVNVHGPDECVEIDSQVGPTIVAWE
jgi:hypothetical protein